MALKGMKKIDFHRDADRQLLLADNSGQSSRDYGWRSIFFEKVEKDTFGTIEHTLDGHYLMVKLSPLAYAKRRVDDTVLLECQRRGYAVYLPHNCPHQVTYTSSLGQLLLMTIPDLLVTEVAEEMGLSHFQGRPLFFDENRLLLETALSIHNELQSGNPHGPMFAEIHGKALAAQIICENNKQARQSVIRDYSLTPRQLRWLDEYIGANLTSRITLNDLARQVDLSPFYFCRQFKSMTGVPPHAYILGKRIDYARGLLQRGDHSILEVALSSGFADASNFCRQFKKSIGKTPSAYRREQRLAQIHFSA